MSISPEGVLIKSPHRRETFTEDQLTDFMHCADADSGPLYFMDHFFISSIPHVANCCITHLTIKKD